MLTLLIHEEKHLQQGIFVALSVYGELEAWQLKFRLYHELTHDPIHPAIAELMTLSLEFDREIMKKPSRSCRHTPGKATALTSCLCIRWGVRSNIGSRENKKSAHGGLSLK
jgi:hypothetical protein